jgi:hypothetical protein
MSIANMPIKNTEGDLFGYQDSCGYRWFNAARVGSKITIDSKNMPEIDAATAREFGQKLIRMSERAEVAATLKEKEAEGINGQAT